MQCFGACSEVAVFTGRLWLKRKENLAVIGLKFVSAGWGLTLYQVLESVSWSLISSVFCFQVTGLPFASMSAASTRRSDWTSSTATGSSDSVRARERCAHPLTLSFSLMCLGLFFSCLSVHWFGPMFLPQWHFEHSWCLAGSNWSTCCRLRL